MIVNLSRSDFTKGVKTAMTCVKKNPTNYIMKTILVETLDSSTISFSGNSTDIGVIIKLPASVLEPGSFCIDGETASKIAMALPSTKEEVVLEMKDTDSVLIKCGKAKQTVPVFKGEEFVKVDGGQKGKAPIEVPTDEAVFLDCLKVLKPFLSFQNTGAVMMRSMLLKTSGSSAILLATDGKELCRVSATLFPEGTQIESEAAIPSEHITAVMRTLDGKVGSDFRILFYPDATRLVFTKKTFDEEIYIRVSLFAEKYPDIAGVIPKQYEMSLQFDKNELKDAVVRASNFINDKGMNAVVLDIKENEVANVSVNTSLGNYSEDVAVTPVECKCKPLRLGFDPKFMLDMIGAQISDDMVLNFISNRAPVTSMLNATVAEIFLLIMPVNIR